MYPALVPAPAARSAGKNTPGIRNKLPAHQTRRGRKTHTHPARRTHQFPFLPAPVAKTGKHKVKKKIDRRRNGNHVSYGIRYVPRHKTKPSRTHAGEGAEMWIKNGVLPENVV